MHFFTHFTKALGFHFLLKLFQANLNYCSVADIYHADLGILFYLNHYLFYL